jgi:solute carrier family 25 carnitine/acylcarnitine transporter 20/29
LKRHPLDTLKVKLQAGSKSTGLVNLVRDMAHSEGVRGFYRGMSVPLVLTGGINTFLWGIQYTLVDAIKQQERATVQETMAAAVAGGAVISLVATPIEGIKNRLQAQRGLTLAQGPWFVIKTVYQNLGVKGFYRGLSAVAMCRASNWAYFGSYSFMTTRFTGSDNSSVNTIMFGGLAGVCYWFVAFPFDVIKSKLQTQPDVNPPQYQGMVDCARKVYSKEGIRAFTRGFMPCIVRAFPANAAAYLAFESSMSFLEKY